MKKLLLTLIVALALSGTIFAQSSHWSDFNSHLFMTQRPAVGFVMIDGSYIEHESNWADIEVAAFVGDQCRGHAFLVSYPDDDDYPIFDIAVYYTTANEDFTFRLFDHANNKEYTNCVSNMELHTGTSYNQYYISYEINDAVILQFTSEEPGEVFRTHIHGYGTGEGYYYLIGTPIGDVAATEVDSLLYGQYDLYYFDPTGTIDDEGRQWINYKDAEDGGFDLETGKGYLYANSVNMSFKFTGSAYTGDGAVTLQKAGGTWGDWNLISNPFGETAYLPNTDFVVMNEEGSEFMAGTRNSAIPAMAGVFVVASEDGQTLTFTTENPAKSPVAAINISSQSKLIDRAVVNFGNGESLPKFMLDENHTKVYIPRDGKDFSVVSADEQGEMPVNFKAEKDGTYTLSFSNENVEFCYLHLIDNKTGDNVDLLATPSYTFDAHRSDYASRFKLVYAKSDDVNDNFGFISDGNFIINGIEGEATLQVTDITGRILSSETFSGSYSKPVKASAGVYMISLIQGENVRTQKIVVK